MVPEAKRWQIEYSASSLREYLNQLAHFQVELGAVSQNTNRIDLVFNLTAARPERSQTSREDEKRIYFAYNQSRLKQWDRSTISRAGVDPTGRLVVQFYNDDTRSQLRFLEQQHIQREGRELMEVEKTIYRVRPAANGYEYFVHDVTYRKLPN